MPLPSRMPSKENHNNIGEYSLQSKFAGYHAREDATTLPANVLVTPSQNVVIGTSGRLAQVKGYTLDGGSSLVIDSGILSNYDFDNFKGDRRNLRMGFLTSAANDGKLQFRYKSGTTISWIDLMTGLTSITAQFCDWWDNTNLIKLCLWVDGSNNIYSWNGAVTTVASGTLNTITKQGTTTWQQEGFTATGSFTIGATTYTYTGGYTTTTLTGVSATTVGVVAGTEVHQTPVTTALSACTSILSTFAPTTIGCGQRNQVYLGSSTSNNLYISKTTDYTNFAYSSPLRTIGEGALIPLNSPPVKFLPQESKDGQNGSDYDMYISHGKNDWSVINSQITVSYNSTGVVGASYEILQSIKLKTSPLMGALSGKLAVKMKNQIMFIANDNTANFLGYKSYQYIPVLVDFSYPIINDMNSYDFTNGSLFYHKNYAYLAIPEHGIIRIYNMTDQTKEQYSTYNPVEQVDSSQPWFWEAPITYPITGFYVTEDGELGGHGFTASESYLLFTGGSFNGQDIVANATMSFDDKGDRTQSKGSNELWIEGYIKQNTNLNCIVSGDLDAFRTSQTVIVQGANQQFVGYGGGAGSSPLGSRPLGGELGSATTADTLPAWFHVSKTYPEVPFYLEQLSFETRGVDLQWELICFGTNARFTPEGNSSITD